MFSRVAATLLQLPLQAQSSLSSNYVRHEIVIEDGRASIGVTPLSCVRAKSSQIDNNLL